jgi:hypothetical protein
VKSPSPVGEGRNGGATEYSHALLDNV